MKYRFKLIFDLEKRRHGEIQIYQEDMDNDLTFKGNIIVSQDMSRINVIINTLNEHHIHSKYQEDIIDSITKRVLFISNEIYTILKEDRYIGIDTFEYTRED